jgi:hypothetical protein
MRPLVMLAGVVVLVVVLFMLHVLDSAGLNPPGP